jgi:hypothetical protein
MEDDLKKIFKKMEDDLKKRRRKKKEDNLNKMEDKPTKSTKFNLIGCDTIVNSPSFSL